MTMKKLIGFIAVSTLLASPLVSLAAITQVQTATPGVTSFEDFLAIFNTLINWIFTLLLVFAVIFIILAAFAYLTAGGDEEKVGKAHQRIIYAVIAIAVAFLAQGISFVVAQLLKQ